MTSELAGRQAELVAALVAGGPPPAGFDGERIAATRRALLRKRAGLAAVAWPLLAASLGQQWYVEFARRHDGHPSNGPLRDGWDVALALRATASLTPSAERELAARESGLRYDGRSAPRRRRLAGLRRAFSPR